MQKRRKGLHLQTARAIATLYPSDEYVEMIAYHYGRTDAPEAAEWLEKEGVIGRRSERVHRASGHRPYSP